jgi:hypothetical protein
MPLGRLGVQVVGSRNYDRALQYLPLNLVRTPEIALLKEKLSQCAEGQQAHGMSARQAAVQAEDGAFQEFPTTLNVWGWSGPNK